MMAGVDEAGRGALVAEVVAAAVILPPQYNLPGLRDSKRLTAARRESLAQAIQSQAVAWALGSASAVEIDALNIHHASLLAMQRAIEALPRPPSSIMVDGKFCPAVALPCTALVGGDDRIPAIAAASILAKVRRDARLKELEALYPGYGFAQHKGYATRQHLQALAELGPTPEHRRSYAPVKRFL